MKKTLVAIFVAFSLMTGVSQAAKLDKPVYIKYTVKDGDTLESIAKTFWSEEYYFPEFKESIVELNYENVFESREKAGEGKALHPGDIITVYTRNG